MSGYKPFVVTLILLLVLLAACQPTGTETNVEEPAPEATQSPTEPPAAETPEEGNSADTVTAAAVAHLAAELGVAEAEIEVISAEMTEFTDSCLGLGQANESCLQAITPGWVVMLSVGGQEYEVRTDETGEQVRVAVDPTSSDGAADTIAAAVQEFMVGELGVALGDVQVISAEMAEFSDSCLGLGQANESCLQAITPGWLVTVSVNGQEYEVHTDETGEQVRVASQQ